MDISKKDEQSTNTDRCFGIDISHHQATIDWNKISPTGQFPISFMVIRATCGTETLDRKFLEHWKNASAIQGLIIGSYHYYLNSQDPEKQADVFAGQLQAAGFDVCKNFYVIDVEDRSKKTTKSPAGMATDLQKFITYMNSKLDPENKLSITPVIYTTSSYWNEYLGQKSGLNYNLWVARYFDDKPLANPQDLPAESPIGGGKYKTIELPDGKTDYHIWQYSKKGRIDAILSEVDLDVSTLANIRSLLPKAKEALNNVI